MINSELLDTILLEWSYRLKDGIPDVNDPEKVRVLNQVLAENKLPLYEDGLKGSTDVKEGLVCLFYDSICIDRDATLKYFDAIKDTSKLKEFMVPVYQAAKESTAAARYGIDPVSLVKNIESTITSNQKSEMYIITNAISSANTIYEKAPPQYRKSSMITRGDGFTELRDLAVTYIDMFYNVKMYPDNWCPADVYIPNKESAIDKAASTDNLNIGDNSLNAQFYDSKTKSGNILGVSLKQQDARAGKGTSFTRTVLVKDVKNELPTMGSEDTTKMANSFREAVRHIKTYYATSKGISSSYEKIIKGINTIINLCKVFNINISSVKEFQELSGIKIKTDKQDYLEVHQSKLYPQLIKLADNLNAKLEGKDTVKQVETSFIGSHDKFEKYLKDLKIPGISSNVNSAYVNAIKKANTKTIDYVNVLVKKTATYDLASELIDAWLNENKQINDAFMKISKVKNPFIALTLFAIAQHGSNPTFFKVIGSNTAKLGTMTEFPSNSSIKEVPETQNMTIKDSPERAGFLVTYLLDINGHKYNTTLSFGFSEKQIKVEVEELKEA